MVLFVRFWKRIETIIIILKKIHNLGVCGIGNYLKSGIENSAQINNKIISPNISIYMGLYEHAHVCIDVCESFFCIQNFWMMKNF